MATETTIDANNPLFLHPADTPGINLISEQLIGSENYGIWSRAMLIALCAKNKQAFIDGTCRRPATGSSTVKIWERCNAIVLSWIMNSVSKEIFGGIIYSTDAETVWKDLKERFDKVNGSRIFALHRDIGRLTQGNNTISAYYSKLRQFWDEYASLVTLPSCECDSARKYVAHEQQQKLLQFLMGLNDSYLPIRSQILMMNPLPSVGQAFAIISQEESHRSLINSSSLELLENTTSAFFSRQEKSEDRKRDSLKCDYCHWTGHTKSNCYKLVGYPPGHKLYKGKNKGPNQRQNPDVARGKQGGNANLTVKETDEGGKIDSGGVAGTGAGSIFTPEQYAEIIKLLNKEGASNLNTDPVVNMAGPVEWEDNGDW